MIPALTPKVIPAVAKRIYDQWTPVQIHIDYAGPGSARATVLCVRSRIIDQEGSTELSPDPADQVQMVIPNIYAESTDESEDPELVGQYPSTVRDAVLTAAPHLYTAVEALLDAREAR